jgi:hypothetical protein
MVASCVTVTTISSITTCADRPIRTPCYARFSLEDGDSVIYVPNVKFGHQAEMDMHVSGLKVPA